MVGLCVGRPTCPGRLTIKGLHSRTPKPSYRLLLAAVLSFVLMFVDHRTSYLEKPRYVASYLVAPVHYVAHLPTAMMQWGKEQSKSRSQLISENASMERQLLVLQQRVQKLAVLEAENARLRQLLNSAAELNTKVLTAQIIGIDPDPSRQEVVVNKGANDKVRVGQAVLDAKGLLGQVVEAGASFSRVLLVTDSSHALSVQINRNGVRAILAGTGQVDKLRLMYVPTTADVEVGDLLVSTGLDQRYPQGYPVGKIVSLHVEPGDAFMTVEAAPTAEIDKVSHVLLVASEEGEE